MKKLSHFREIEEAKKYTPPTKAEIEADKKKDRAGKPRPSMDSSSIKKNVYKEQTDEPASDDEAGMAMDQAKFIGYVANEIKEYISGNKEFPEWMQNKLTGLHEKAKDMHAVMAGKYNESVEQVDEGAKGYKPGWMLKADPELDKKVKANKDKHKAMVKAMGNPNAGKSVKEAARSPYTGVKVTGPDDLEKEKKHYQAMRAKQRKKELEDSVEHNESTAAYGKSEKERREKEAKARLTPKDRTTLDKLRTMMAKEKK